MITVKNTIIPIFDYRLKIIVFDLWQEVVLYLNNPTLKNSAKGISLNYEGRAIVAVNSLSEDTIVHESGHIKNFIWEYIGYVPLITNDEVDLYLQVYIYKKIYDVYMKHRYKF